ncbi:hypothetical protein [Synechococcus sp. 7002]
MILTYGIMARKPRQGWLIFGMVFIFMFLWWASLLTVSMSVIRW